MPRRPWRRTLQRPSRGGRAGWVKMLLMLRTGTKMKDPLRRFGNLCWLLITQLVCRVVFKFYRTS
jgi:hypothetical protein